MHCWVHQDTLLNEEQTETNMREAWEHEGSKDELNIVLHGLEKHFWEGKEAGLLGCYDFPGETWAGDGLANKGVMGAGSVRFQRPGRNLVVRVGREEEGVSSLRPELAAIARTLQATALEVDLVYLCDSEASLNKVSRWIGSGPRTTIAGDANVDIMTSIIEYIQERVPRGARTFLVKVKAHRGEPLNESDNTQTENTQQLPSECRQWTTRTQRMTYEWQDNDGVKHVTTWSKAVRNAMIRWGAEFHRQKALSQAENNWKGSMGSTDIGLHRIGQEASTGDQSDLIGRSMDRGSVGRKHRAEPPGRQP
jgi:ribonuclease HI